MARLPAMQKSRPPDEWAYVYHLAPLLDEPTRATITEVLAEENVRARRRRARWMAKLIIEDGQARILVLCESPAQDRKVNRRLEAHLRRLWVEFSVTVPMAIGDDMARITPARRDRD